MEGLHSLMMTRLTEDQTAAFIKDISRIGEEDSKGLIDSPTSLTEFKLKFRKDITVLFLNAAFTLSYSFYVKDRLNDEIKAKMRSKCAAYLSKEFLELLDQFCVSNYDFGLRIVDAPKICEDDMKMAIATCGFYVKEPKKKKREAVDDARSLEKKSPAHLLNLFSRFK